MISADLPKMRTDVIVFDLPQEEWDGYIRVDIDTRLGKRGCVGCTIPVSDSELRIEKDSRKWSRRNKAVSPSVVSQVRERIREWGKAAGVVVDIDDEDGVVIEAVGGTSYACGVDEDWLAEMIYTDRCMGDNCYSRRFAARRQSSRPYEPEVEEAIAAIWAMRHGLVCRNCLLAALQPKAAESRDED